MPGSVQQTEALEGLHDVVAPEAVSWLPQTPGWYLLFVLFVAGLTWFAVRRYRRWKANRYRAAALDELNRIEALAQSPSSRAAALAELSVLVKRTALSFERRTAVANLSGESWLHFLDSTSRGTEFSSGPGRLLLDASYRPSDALNRMEESEITKLFNLLRRWIIHHRSPSPSPFSSPSNTSELEVGR